MLQVTDKYQKHDFWGTENLKYSEPHFRLEKVARMVNRIAGDKDCDLLDVGCGPAALMRLLRKNINYHGIDIAIQNPAPYLLQRDFVENPIKFGNRRFDIIVAQGVFEYVGKFQTEKFSEISQLLNEKGTFIASYVNFNHRQRYIYAPYNNVQPFDVFRKSLSRFFRIDRVLPTSHHLHHHEPNRKIAKAIQMHVNVNIPLFSKLLAVEYFFICSPLGPRR
jgi:cyclopropane fatty-acyl-phospholipid synthase-like methyltransferase